MPHNSIVCGTLDDYPGVAERMRFFRIDQQGQSIETVASQPHALPVILNSLS